MLTLLTPTALKTLAIALLLQLGAGACAAGALDGQTGLLGQSRERIEAALEGARQVHSPRRLPSGATGQLRQADMLYEGAHFEQTLFFAQQKLQQIELVSLPGAGPEVWRQLLASLKAELGAELAAGDSASWVRDDTDVVLYRYGRPEAPTVRLLIRQRRLADASEL